MFTGKIEDILFWPESVTAGAGPLRKGSGGQITGGRKNVDLRNRIVS